MIRPSTLSLTSWSIVWVAVGDLTLPFNLLAGLRPSPTRHARSG
jgi:hypothetical protein